MVFEPLKSTCSQSGKTAGVESFHEPDTAQLLAPSMASPGSDRDDDADATPPFDARATFVRAPGVGDGTGDGVGLGLGATVGVGLGAIVGVGDG